jgi:P-type E1-E2 ATPase
MEEGIVVFDETLFEKLRNVETVVFDKTGTLTTGKMTVVDSYGSADALRSAASVEVLASHPVAEAIADEFEPEGGTEVEEFESFATGVAGKVGDEKVLVGDTDLFEEQGWQVTEDIARHVTDAKNSGRLPVIVGREGEAEAVIVLSDEPREGWAETVTRLKEKGMKVVVLTGDSERATRLFDGNEGVDTVFADVPPEGKKEAIRRLSEDGKVAMVGDGTNDAPALAQADFSVSMGGGTALASDAADLAVTEGDISLVERAFELSDTSHRRYRQNLWLSFSYVLITVPLAVSGFLNSFFTVSAAVVVLVLLLVNSYRPLL